jgi:hypothetical protein
LGSAADTRISSVYYVIGLKQYVVDGQQGQQGQQSQAFPLRFFWTNGAIFLPLFWIT